jgi:hypothetical protein
VSYIYENSYLELEIYRLVTILAASPELADVAASEEVYDEDERNIVRLRRWEEPEIARIMVSIAAIVRGAVQSGTANALGQATPPGSGLTRWVGTLQPDITKDHKQDLLFEDALHKVIHATRVDHLAYLTPWEREDIKAGLQESMAAEDYPHSGRMHLYGHWKGKQWKAELYLRSYAMAAMTLLP